jgi:hypothetical protein
MLQKAPHGSNYTVFNAQAYQNSQYVVPRGCIFIGKWRSSFAGNSNGKMNVQPACALNTIYKEFSDVATEQHSGLRTCRFVSLQGLCGVQW